MKTRAGILGSGMVGLTLAKGLRGLGYEVAVGKRKGTKADNWDGNVGTYADVSANADSIVVAVKGTAAEAVIRSVKDKLEGKTVIDATNPIADAVPDDGV